MENAMTMYSDRVYKKCNYLVASQYRGTLLDNKLFAISIASIGNGNTTRGEDGVLRSEFKVSDLRALMHNKSGSFYEQLKAAADTMTCRSIRIEDPEKNYFDYMVIITRAKYENGTFMIEYNRSAEKYLVDIKTNYTPYDIECMMKFKSSNSFRLYELLRSKAFLPRNVKVDIGHEYTYTISLAELKITIGIVNANLDTVKKYLSGKDYPDYEKACEISPEKIFTEWRDFKKRVLDKAKEEINQITDIEIDYKPIRGGKGGKIQKIEFKIKYKEPKLEIEKPIVQEDCLLSDMERDDTVDFIRDMIKESISTKDIRAIARAADYDIKKVDTAYSIYKQAGNINNMVGFMIQAIKEEYENNRVRKENNFLKIEKRDYDFESLENEILAN